MKFAAAFVATTLLAGAAGQETCVTTPASGAGTCNVYSGYQSTSDVSEHSKIAMDAEEIYDLTSSAGDGDWAAAKTIYEDGKNSAKSGGKIRTIKGFSVNSDKLVNAGTNMFLSPFQFKYGTTEYGHDLVEAAFDDDALDDLARKELINKGLVYNVINPYVMHELVDALNDCVSGDSTNNDDSVKAWDEAVAFWVGSTQPAQVGEKSGHLGYSVTEKRGDNFDTISTDTVTSSANAKILDLFNEGKALIEANTCTGVNEIKLMKIIIDINSQMTVFAVQGTLRYAYKNEQSGATVNAKERAEGAAFMHAVAPVIHAFDPVQAAILFDNMEYDGYNPTVATYANVYAVFEKTLHGLGLKCADINTLVLDDIGTTAGPACVDPDTSDSDAKLPAKLAGYIPGSNVLDHARIDLDVSYMDMYLEVNDFKSAQFLYQNGRFSKGGDRTVAGFSKKAGVENSNLKQVPLFEVYKKYWDSGTYADDFVMRAFEKEEEFKDASDIAVAESVIKGAVYQNVFMYVLREFWDGIIDCNNGEITDNAGRVHAWDEGVAFYVGQLEYADDSGPGVLGWKLGDKRCANFGTCVSDSSLAKVNSELRTLFNSGRDYLEASKCQDATDLMPEITKQMSIPLIQGTLRYAYKMETSTENRDKNGAEGWAFAAAILPAIDACDSTAAKYIHDSMKYDVNKDVSYAKIFSEMRSVYECMGLTCEDVGELQGVSPATKLCQADIDSYVRGASSSLKVGIVSSILVAMTAFIIA